MSKKRKKKKKLFVVKMSSDDYNNFKRKYRNRLKYVLIMKLFLGDAG